MKKLFTLVLALIMVLGSMSISVFADENKTTLTVNIDNPLSYDMIIPEDVTITKSGITEIGTPSVKNIKNAKDSTVISYTVTSTQLTLSGGSKTVATSYYIDSEGKNAMPDTAIEVYKNNAFVNPLTTLYVGITANDWSAADSGTYTATVTFNFNKESTSSMPAKGSLITLDGQNAQYKVLKINGSNAEVFDVTGCSKKFNESSQTTKFSDGNNYQKYADSNLDTYLNGNTDGCYYYGLSDNIKNSIVAQNITQYAYSYSDAEPEEAWTFEYQHKWSETDIEYVTESGYVSVGTRNIYALDVKDVFEYYSKGTNDLLTSNELNNLFFGQETSIGASCWLRSAYTNDTDYIWYIDGTIGFKDSKYIQTVAYAHATFTIDLSKCTWEFATSN